MGEQEFLLLFVLMHSQKFYALWALSCHFHPFSELYRSLSFLSTSSSSSFSVMYSMLLSLCVSVWVIEIINCSVFCTNSFIWISCWALAFWIIYQRFEKFKVRSPKKCAFLMRNLFLFRPAPFIWVCCLLHFHHSSSSAFLFLFLFLLSALLIVSAVLFIDCVLLIFIFFLHPFQFDLFLFLSVWEHYATIKYLWWAFFSPIFHAWQDLYTWTKRYGKFPSKRVRP